MNQQRNKINSLSSLVAACSLGTSGVKIFAVLPLLLGVIAQHLSLDESQAGMVASLYYGAYFLATLTSFIWIRRLSWRTLAILGSALIVVGLVSSAMFNHSFEGVVSGLMISGLGAAIVYALSVTLVSDMQDKDRRFAIKLIPEQVIPALLLLLLPALVIEPFGLQGMLLALAATICLLSLLSAKTPSVGLDHKPEQAQLNKPFNKALVFVGLGALVVFFAGFAAIWAFTEILVHDVLDSVLVGQLLGLGLVSSALGPFVAAILADRWGRNLPIIAGVVLTLLSMILLVGQINAIKFAVFMAVFPAAYYFTLSYLFGIISDADVSGRNASLIASALALGAAAGPGIFGLILEGSGNNAAYVFAGVLILLGGAVFIWLERRLERAHISSLQNEAAESLLTTS